MEKWGKRLGHLLMAGVIFWMVHGVALAQAEFFASPNSSVEETETSSVEEPETIDLDGSFLDGYHQSLPNPTSVFADKPGLAAEIGAGIKPGPERAFLQQQIQEDERWANNYAQEEGYGSANEILFSTQKGKILQYTWVNPKKLSRFKEGDNPNDLLIDTEKAIVLTTVNGEFRSTVTVDKRLDENPETGDPRLRWRWIAKGKQNIVGTYFDLRKESFQRSRNLLAPL
jgi:hypothetical protein